ncbi:MAG: UGSC family (seleno)protein [Candidatus Rokuibacteriota bacterium]
MVTLEFFDPSGRLEVKQPHAPRLDGLAGKRVGFVSNEQWQAYRMLPLLKSLLERDFAGIEVLPIDAFPQGNALIGSEETAEQVRKSGVDAVIIGNAA